MFLFARSVLLVLVLASAIAAPAWAQRVDQLPPGSSQPTVMNERIAAIVNDNVISTSDVQSRLAMALLSSGLPDTPDIRARILPQVLHALVDEQLQLQEAKRIEINVTQEEIDQAEARIARQNNLPGDIKGFLSSHNVPPAALDAQVRAGLAWNKVVQRELRSRVDIGDDEVDAAVERIRSNAGKEEYLVSEIYLSVDNPRDEEQVKQFAENLAQQIKGGANFGAVARQFSQGTGAASGGDIGWIQAGQLPQELDRTLLSMQVNEITGPVRAANGYHIFGLRDKRVVAGGDPKDITVNLQQAFRPFGNAPDKEGILREAAQLRETISSCDGLQGKLSEKFPSWRWQDLGDVKLAAAPSWLTDKVRNLQVGQASDPMDAGKGALVLFVCKRSAPDNINREAVYNAIGTEKLELQARHLLRDLRRSAYIDVKLTGLP